MRPRRRALRRHSHPRARGVGAPAAGPDVTATGFEGRDHHRRWARAYGATVICPPKRSGARPWPRRWRRWLARQRQIVETIVGALLHTFRLDRERPHTLAGLQARLAAKMALHNFCLGFNAQLGRPQLAFADLVDW